MGELVQFVPGLRRQPDLRSIGEAIIRSPEFQANISAYSKDAVPFCPVAVAIMHGHMPDTAPAEWSADESDPA